MSDGKKRKSKINIKDLKGPSVSPEHQEATRGGQATPPPTKTPKPSPTPSPTPTPSGTAPRLDRWTTDAGSDVD